jgi:hypothetical protein
MVRNKCCSPANAYMAHRIQLKELHEANNAFEKLPRNLVQNSYVTLDMMNKKIFLVNYDAQCPFLFKELSNSFNDTSAAIKDTSMYFKKCQALQLQLYSYFTLWQGKRSLH